MTETVEPAVHVGEVTDEPLSEAPAAPAFSPNVQSLAFRSDRDGDFEIFKIRTDGSKQKRLTRNQEFDAEPTFSRDGGQIAITSNGGSSAINLGIYTANADGSGQIRITSTSTYDFEPDWQRR